MLDGKLDITNRSFRFGVEIVKLSHRIPRSPRGFRIGGQIVGSGTSIGANIQEAQNASSKKDFINKMTIALREARETLYWLKIISEAKIIVVPTMLIDESEALIKIVTTIIKKTKANCQTNSN